MLTKNVYVDKSNTVRLGSCTKRLRIRSSERHWFDDNTLVSCREFHLQGEDKDRPIQIDGKVFSGLGSYGKLSQTRET